MPKKQQPADGEEYKEKLPQKIEEDDEDEDDGFDEYMKSTVKVNFVLDTDGLVDVFMDVGENLTVPEKAHLIVSYLLMIKQGLFIDNVKEALDQWGEDNGQPEISIGCWSTYEEMNKQHEVKKGGGGAVIKPSEVFRNLQRAAQ